MNTTILSLPQEEAEFINSLLQKFPRFTRWYEGKKYVFSRK